MGPTTLGTILFITQPKVMRSLFTMTPPGTPPDEEVAAKRQGQAALASGRKPPRNPAAAQSGGGRRNTLFPLALPRGSFGKFWLSDTNVTTSCADTVKFTITVRPVLVVY